MTNIVCHWGTIAAFNLNLSGILKIKLQSSQKLYKFKLAPTFYPYQSYIRPPVAILGKVHVQCLSMHFVQYIAYIHAHCKFVNPHSWGNNVLEDYNSGGNKIKDESLKRFKSRFEFTIGVLQAFTQFWAKIHIRD